MSIIRVRDKNGNIIDIPAIKGNDYILTETDKENIATKTADLIQQAECIPLGSAENKLAQLVDDTLTEITAEDLQGVTDIVDYAFYKRTNLMKLTIPNTIKSTGFNSLLKDKRNGAIYFEGDLAFYCSIAYNRNGGHPFCFKNVYVKNATGEYELIEGDIVIPSHIPKISLGAFQNADITSVTISSGVEAIDGYAFFKCPNLTSVVIPDTVTSLGAYVFGTCEKLISIRIPTGVTVLHEYAFNQCRALTEVILPEGLTILHGNAFASCSSLTNLTIPSTVTKLRYMALNIGTSTNKATIRFLSTTPPSLESSNVFYTPCLDKIIVPKGCSEAYKAATNWSTFADYIEEAAE